MSDVSDEDDERKLFPWNLGFRQPVCRCNAPSSERDRIRRRTDILTDGWDSYRAGAL